MCIRDRRMGFGHEAASLARRQRAQLVECPSWEQHRCALRALEADAPDELGVRLGAAKQGGKGVCADERLVCLDERGCIAPVHGLHPQAHGVASERLVVHDEMCIRDRDSTGTSSSITVHRPHADVSQPRLTLLHPWARTKSMSSMSAGMSSTTVLPFSLILTSI